MPNVGRPSRGCQNCRTRKVKCDQKRPSCLQCVHAGKQCHGYRDPLSTMFKNESNAVAKKAEKRYEHLLARQKAPPLNKKNQDPTTPDFDFPENWAFGEDRLPHRASTQIVPCTRYPTPESMTFELVPSIEDQALGFFIGNYVAQPNFIPRGQFEWVVEMLAQPDTEEILRSSVNAASLAGFANATKSPTIMQKAQTAYGSALRMTNNALRSRNTAVKDSTLISVIMLGMYENFVFQDKRSMQAWAKHVDGACALLNLRGKDQFQSSLGRRLFHQFYGVVLLVALETGRAVHEGMHDLYTIMTPDSDYSVHGRQWTTRMIDAMHRAINLNQDKETDPKTMIAVALDIDRQLTTIKALMPNVWHYETVHLEQLSEHLHGSKYHVYLDPWIAQMWNNLQSCRICIYKLVRESLAKGCTQYTPPLFSPDEYELIKARAEEVTRATAALIVASVPQITGMIPFPDLSTAKRRASAPNPDETSPTYKLQPSGAFLDPSQSTHMVHLIWPLYTAAQSDLATMEMRQWAIEMLHYIALRIGTKQAVVLANELREIQRTGLSSTPFVDRITLPLLTCG